MTSEKTTGRECFVYITLPGQIKPVTAGRFSVTTEKGLAIGNFTYGKKYLERPDKVEVDPVELVLSSKAYETTALKGIFGALRDASPDHWGRRVIERNIGGGELTELDYLLNSPDDRAGALGFGLNQSPPAPLRHFNKTIELDKLQQIADVISKDEELPGDHVSRQVQELMLVGTSMGGARPKAVVEDEHGLWIAKFNDLKDRWNNARVEKAMLSLARLCGITTEESKMVTVAGRDVLLVKRFDREKTEEGYLRYRMVSGLTLIQAEDTYESRDKWSYISLAETLRRVCSRAEDNAREIFRRMCFNALISNSDDHPRNHAVIAKNVEWKLSPAYDITPNPQISRERRELALKCGDYGRYANAENILSQSKRFLIEPDEAKKIVDEMEQLVKNSWYKVAKGEGVSESDCERIQGAFAYPGFRMKPF
jgi:serine/threonine-protein kinase HipA